MTIGSDVSYIALLTEYRPRPLKNEAEYETAASRVNDLLAKVELTAEQNDLLELMTMLMHEYEKKHHPVPDLHGVELLKTLMVEWDLKQKDLVEVFKTPSIVSEVLAGRRELKREHIEKLSLLFAVSPAVFFPKSAAPQAAQA